MVDKKAVYRVYYYIEGFRFFSGITGPQRHSKTAHFVFCKKGGEIDEKNLSAQKTSSEERTRIS